MTFARPSPDQHRQRRAAERERNLAALTASPSAVRGVYAAVGGPLITLQKECAVYSEAYRRVVASFCCARCFVVGYSQAAHPPPTGKGRKEDDRAVFPLCCDRPGQVGCHPLFDQYKLMPHDEAVEQAAQWGRETRAKVINRGLWPKGLSMWEKVS